MTASGKIRKCAPSEEELEGSTDKEGVGSAKARAHDSKGKDASELISHEDKMRALAGISYDDFANLMTERRPSAPAPKFKVVHYYPRSSILDDELSTISPFGCLGLVQHRFKQTFNSVSEDPCSRFRGRVLTCIDGISREDFFVGSPFWIGRTAHFDVTLFNTAFHNELWRAGASSHAESYSYGTAHAPIGPDQVLLLVNTLDLGVSLLDVAKQVKSKVDQSVEITIETLQNVLIISTSKDPSISSASFALHLSCAASTALSTLSNYVRQYELRESVEITNTFSIHSELPTREENHHLEFEGTVYALGRYRSIRDFVPDCFIVDLSGMEFAGNENRIYCLTQHDV
ncbi:hypothetical protein PaG_03889 [Moesziomyces aphidis]|uniref:Uncharacterized protein n=1 Tax=Moesziomyces aphidis TaxID=84754 RepID=W3VJW7_MOEAP|nr:hypothetical protein PaG_03889 [Moesziomyces aphidis]